MTSRKQETISTEQFKRPKKKAECSGTCNYCGKESGKALYSYPGPWGLTLWSWRNKIHLGCAFKIYMDDLKPMLVEELSRPSPLWEMLKKKTSPPRESRFYFKWSKHEDSRN